MVENNGIKIKKYRAEVTYIGHCGEIQIKEVAGYVSIAAVALGKGKMTYDYIFVSDEILWENMQMSLSGMTFYKPCTYDNFKILGEVEE